jgi:hypothetical protein
MVKDRNEGTDFSENIDRIISGREPSPGSDQAAEHSSELTFARRIKQTRSSPSDAFQASLKANLLHKIAEMETAQPVIAPPSPATWLSGLIRRHTWQVVGTALVVLIIALAISWKIGLFSPSHPVVTITSPPVAVVVQASLDKATYSTGEMVNLTFTVTNRTDTTLSFIIPPAFRIETPEANPIRSFPVGDINVSVQPDVTTSYTVTWDQTDDNGNPAPAGTYHVVVPNVPLGDAGFLSLSQSPDIILAGP